MQILSKLNSSNRCQFVILLLKKKHLSFQWLNIENVIYFRVFFAKLRYTYYHKGSKAGWDCVNWHKNNDHGDSATFVPLFPTKVLRQWPGQIKADLYKFQLICDSKYEYNFLGYRTRTNTFLSTSDVRY